MTEFKQTRIQGDAGRRPHPPEQKEAHFFTFSEKRPYYKIKERNQFIPLFPITSV